MIRPVAVLLAVGLALLLPAAAGAQTLQGTGVKLQGLDKISARIFAFEAPLDQPVTFGYLQIVARACVATPEDDVPESTAFLEVSEAKPGAQPVQVFTGWMFASSPSASAMEHAVYDLWVVGCAGLPGQDESASGVTPPPEKPGAVDSDIEAPTDDAEQPLD
mgnify:CR=1 FL=1